MPLLTRLTCAVMLIGLLSAVPAAGAASAQPSARIAAATKTKCTTYPTHKACVVLHRSAKGRVWATAYIDKLSGTSNRRWARASVWSRPCRGTTDTRRQEKGSEVAGNRTASSVTASVPWSSSLRFEATVAGGWARTKRLSEGMMVYERKDIVLRTAPITSCDP